MLGRNDAFSSSGNAAFSSSGVNNDFGSAPNTLKVLAGEVIGYPRLVEIKSGNAYLFDPAAAIPGNAIGLTNHSAASGASITVTVSGEYSYGGWGLSPNQVVYAIANGLISSIPPALGLIQPIGVAISVDRLLLNLTSAINQI